MHEQRRRRNPLPVDRSDGKTYMRTNKSREGSPMERSKPWESNPVVRVVERIPVGHSKSREINPMVRMVSYAKVLRRNILPGYSIDAYSF